MKQVYLASDPINAELVRNHLADHGVETVVKGALLWGGRGDLPADTYPSIWVVNDADFERGRTLALGWEKPRAAGLDWRCRECGERLGGQFTACWNCGHPRD